MTIHLAAHQGMCFGVRDALSLAEKLAAQGPLTVLGEIVHNPLARERLRRLGAREGRLTTLDSATAEAPVLITAHGASDERRRAWRTAGFAVADATCPLVRRAHRQLGALVAAGFHPVVIGQPGHSEVLGLTGDFPNASVLDSDADLAALPNKARFGIIAQTTRPIADALRLVAELRAARPAAEVLFCDTVCQPTKDRQRALGELLAEVDVVVVVGGNGSNNTRQLARTAAEAGRRVWTIERADDLRPEWFSAGERVGLTAGTSTLPETVAVVQARLREIAAALSGKVSGETV